MRKLGAFVTTIAFAVVFGLPWILLCGLDPREWWSDMRFLYRALSSK